MNLSKVESVGVDQGILGRILGYGCLVINGTGSSKEHFHNIRGPLMVAGEGGAEGRR